MGDCDARDGAGIVRSPRRRRSAVACAVLRGMLALVLLHVAASSSAGWDSDRMLRAAAGAGQRAENAARDLRDLLLGIQGREVRYRLEAVNDHFNRTVSFADDVIAWGQEDYWASPVETLSKSAGDCEDYAIGKYFSLIAVGVPVASLRLVYVRAMLPAAGGQPARSQAHMVLAYYDDRPQDPMILDNLVAQVRRASQRADLTPVFSFNSEGIWQGAGTQMAGDPMARLSRWRDVVRKARLEGFE